jgi:hypothetical protein
MQYFAACEDLHRPSCLQAAVVEYLAAAAAHGAQLPAPLQLLNLQLTMQQGQTDQLALQLYSQWRNCPAQLAEQLGTVAALQDQQADAALPTSNHPPASAAVAFQVRGALFIQDGILGAAAPSIPRQAVTDSRGQPGISGGVTGPTNAPGLTAGAFASSSAGTSNTTSQAGTSADEVMVRSLLSSGAVLRAARLVRDLHLTSVLPQDLLAAAARTGQASCFAAVYRAFRESLMPVYPSFEAAQAAYGLAASA